MKKLRRAAKLQFGDTVHAFVRFVPMTVLELSGRLGCTKLRVRRLVTASDDLVLWDGRVWDKSALDRHMSPRT